MPAFCATAHNACKPLSRSLLALLPHTDIGAFFKTEKEKRGAIGKALGREQGAAANSVLVSFFQLCNNFAVTQKSGRAEKGVEIFA
ncbi:MAG: hypothetical protein ACI4JY_04390 [Oscillospiraceae bacterium]